MMRQTRMLFCGCSITAGAGLPGEKTCPQLWVNQIADLIGSTQAENAAMTGRNNYWIFMETLCKIINDSYDIVIVAWSGIPRYCFHAGLELYSTHTMLYDMDINLVGGNTVPGKWLQETGDRLRKLHNDHWDIVELIKYVNTLSHVQHARGGQIFFVNAMCPWSADFFAKKYITVPTDLDPYTHDLLQCDLRHDDDIFELYHMIHEQYAQVGTVRPELWLNLYSSLRSMQIDNASRTDHHPGIQSQETFVQCLWSTLKQKIESS